MNNASHHIWHPISHPNRDFQGIDPMHIVSGDGVYIRDDQGKKYLDGNAGLWCVNVGYNRQEMKDSIKAQLDQLSFYQLFKSATHPSATELAAKLVNMMQPEKMKRVFFTSGGSDSNESAIKLARQFHLLNGEPGRRKVISLKRSYHGSHFGCMAVTGYKNYERAYGPFFPDVISLDAPFLYRNPWSCDDPELLVEYCIKQLIAEIEFHQPNTIAALIAEPIIANTMIIPPASYWPKLREVCDNYGILLIADEVVTGFGRSGSLFGCRGWGVAPDMMCLAKGISSAYVPLGAVMINERMAKVWESNSHMDGFIITSITYAGHPLACAAGLAALNIVEKDNLAEKAKQQGRYLLNKLVPFIDRFKSVGDVRGKGLMLCLDFVSDKKTRQPIDLGVNGALGLNQKIADIARREGVIIRPLGNLLIIAPPLIFTKEHCDKLVDVLEQAFIEADI